MKKFKVTVEVEGKEGKEETSVSSSSLVSMRRMLSETSALNREIEPNGKRRIVIEIERLPYSKAKAERQPQPQQPRRHKVGDKVWAPWGGEWLTITAVRDNGYEFLPESIRVGDVVADMNGVALGTVIQVQRKDDGSGTTAEIKPFINTVSIFEAGLKTVNLSEIDRQAVRDAYKLKEETGIDTAEFLESLKDTA